MSHSIPSIGSAPVPRPQSTVESATQEALETPAVTRQEALKGDRVAQRKLERERRTQLATEAPGESASGSTEKKFRVNVVA
jgi:hypothetical protein